MMARALMILRFSLRALPQAALSSFTSFHGVQELKYSFPKCARPMTACRAFLKSHAERNLSYSVYVLNISEDTFSSGLSFSGMVPKFL